MAKRRVTFEEPPGEGEGPDGPPRKRVRGRGGGGEGSPGGHFGVNSGSVWGHWGQAGVTLGSLG